ncbi:MAG: winged helix-turn-helix transcriptional regulator [Candidatus Bathyarchaeota archaeon]
MAIAEESLLIKALGNSPKLRIIDFLLDNPFFDFSKKEIIEGAGLSKTTFYKIWNDLNTLGIIKVSRTYGKTKLYKLNKEARITQMLLKLDLYLTKKHAEIAHSEATGILVKPSMAGKHDD